MLKAPVVVLMVLCSVSSQADEFNVCKDMVIDQITEMAFGPQGAPYTGEVVCYRDKEETVLKSKRVFDEGKPIGRHVCYNKDGVPVNSISYDLTKVKKRSFNYTPHNEKENPVFGKIECMDGSDGTCWSDQVCKKYDRWCVFRCE